MKNVVVCFLIILFDICYELFWSTPDPCHANIEVGHYTMWDYMRLHCTQSIALHHGKCYIDFFPTEMRIDDSEKRGWVKNPNSSDEFFN